MDNVRIPEAYNESTQLADRFVIKGGIFVGGFFNMEGAFFKFGNALADIMILSLLWIFFSIPIFTVGAATTALFYVTTRRVSDREGYLFKDFCSSFKSNFKQATIIWLIWLLIGGILIANIYMLINFDFDPLMVTILLPVQVIILFELFITSIYLYPIIARFDMDTKQIIKTSFFMANRHLMTTFTAIGIIIIIFFSASRFFEPLIIFAMGVYAQVLSYRIMYVFKKYRPEMDTDHILDGSLMPLPILNEPENEISSDNDEPDKNENAGG